MLPSKRLTILCDSFILEALEEETSTINRLNSQTRSRQLRTNEVAREILANWACEQLASHGTQGAPALFEQAAENRVTSLFERRG